MNGAEISAEGRQEANRRLFDALDEVVDDLGIATAEPAEKAVRPGRRRGLGLAPRDQIELLFVEQDGVLFLAEGARTPPVGGLRRRGRREIGLELGGGTVVKRTPLARLERSAVPQALESIDARLTPHQGLRELRDGRWEAAGSPLAKGRILLFVHGTFSNNDSLLEQLLPDGERTSGPGRDFVDWCRTRYDQVLAYDHPTLAVSPMVNAREMALALAPARLADLDVVCHSRGGLVTRWWLEAFDRAAPRRRRAVFVGSPLNGTALAAPPNLRGGLSVLANLSRALGEGRGKAPILTLLSSIFHVVSSVTGLAAKTPAIDAAVALVPGLAAMSRVGNNFELLSLRRSAVEVTGRYFAVQSNFESGRPGWDFWRRFRRLPGMILDRVADAVFDGPNDLVVDTSSMSNFEDELVLPADQVLDFGTRDDVHHVNYFQQAETLEFIRSRLG